MKLNLILTSSRQEMLHFTYNHIKELILIENIHLLPK
nr:MAG TPA: hypothetical protein [Caudoviricetes sp.]